MLGALHEQSRPDHGSYVKVLWENIQPKYRSQYSTYGVEDQTVPYDVMSLMHYGDTDFAFPGKKAMEYVQKTTKIMGNRMGLTHADVLQLARMYKCEGQQKQFKLCPQNPKACMKEECVCTQGSGFFKKIEGECNRCVQQCPDAPYGNKVCGCPAGCSMTSFTLQSGTYFSCNPGCTKPPTPVSPTTPPTKPPTTPSPSSSTKCDGDSATFQSKYGDCASYAGYNKPYCASDTDLSTGRLAEKVCPQCEMCE